MDLAERGHPSVVRLETSCSSCLLVGWTHGLFISGSCHESPVNEKRRRTWEGQNPPAGMGDRPEGVIDENEVNEI